MSERMGVVVAHKMPSVGPTRLLAGRQLHQSQPAIPKSEPLQLSKQQLGVVVVAALAVVVVAVVAAAASPDGAAGQRPKAAAAQKSW